MICELRPPWPREVRAGIRVATYEGGGGDIIRSVEGLNSVPILIFILTSSRSTRLTPLLKFCNHHTKNTVEYYVVIILQF